MLVTLEQLDAGFDLDSLLTPEARGKITTVFVDAMLRYRGSTYATASVVAYVSEDGIESLVTPQPSGGAQERFELMEEAGVDPESHLWASIDVVSKNTAGTNELLKQMLLQAWNTYNSGREVPVIIGTLRHQAADTKIVQLNCTRGDLNQRLRQHGVEDCYQWGAIAGDENFGDTLICQLLREQEAPVSASA